LKWSKVAGEDKIFRTAIAEYCSRSNSWGLV